MYNQQEFSKLIADVEKEFSSFLAKAESADTTSEVQALSKSEEEGEKKPEDKDKENKEEPKHESKPNEEHEEKDQAPPKDGEKEESAPEHEEGGDEGHGYDDEDMNHMHEMYGSMNKHELKAHHDSVRAALDKCSGMDKSDQAPEQAPPAPMQKSEIVISLPVTSPELELVKSELAAEKAKGEELKKSLELMTNLINKIVKKQAPQGKAVTSVDVLAKSETTEENDLNLSADQIAKILTEKTRDSKLSKSDREAIDGFYSGRKSITTINHLLK